MRAWVRVTVTATAVQERLCLVGPLRAGRVGYDIVAAGVAPAKSVETFEHGAFKLGL